MYRRVGNELRRRIDDGELVPGERLPPEAELAAEWGVNRLTIRQAIAELARAGSVHVRQGAGTYVAEPPVIVELGLPMMPSADADAGSLAAAPALTTAEQVEVLIAKTDADTSRAPAENLAVPGPFVRLDTLVSIDSRPFMVCSYWLDAGRFPGLADHIDHRVAMYQVLRERFSVRLRHSWRNLTAVLAESDDAALLEVSPGSAIMLREGVNVDHLERPTVYLRRRIRGDSIRFRMHYELD